LGSRALRRPRDARPPRGTLFLASLPHHDLRACPGPGVAAALLGMAAGGGGPPPLPAVAESLAPGAAAAAAGKAAGPPSTEKAPEGQCMAELTVVRPNGAEQRFELRFGGVVCIGRGGKSDVSSDFSGVSLRHVELFLQPAASDELGPPRLFARDCSKNGTGVRQAAGPEDGGAARGFVRVMPDTPCAMGQGSQILVPMRSRKGDVQKPEEERTFTLRVAFPAATALSSVSTAEEEADRAGPMEPAAASVAAAAAESPVAPQPTPAVLEEQGPDQQENRDAAGGHKERWQRKRKKKEKEKQQLAASGVEVEVEELRKQPKDTKPPEAQSSESARTAQARREEELLIDAEIAEELARTARPKRKGRGRRELREDGYEAPILVAEQALEEAGVAVEAPITDAGEVSDHSGTVVPDSLFDKIDQNHDGVISREELADAMSGGIVREVRPELAGSAMNYPACGNLNMEDLRFSRRCGCPRECRNVGSCPSCGNLYMEDSRFCRRCGRPREC